MIISTTAEYIKNSELVAFPTETVYGLGASAFNPEAVKKIFLVKERPAQNPLLIHVSSIDQVKKLVKQLPNAARVLMDKFWPGPLSLVLPASDNIPSVVRGGKASIGLRMPSHPVALALIDAAGPIAAPSANLSGRPSPVTAEHVRTDLDGKIAAVLDAGPTGIGLESTIIDLTGTDYRVLRQGGLPVETLEEVLGRKIETDILQKKAARIKAGTKVIICNNDKDLQNKLSDYSASDNKIAVVCNQATEVNKPNSVTKYYLEERAGNLYTILRDAEDQSIDILLFEPFPKDMAQTVTSLLARIYSRS